MVDRPLQLWKDMPLAKRALAAEAFWRDQESPDIEAQHVEAIVALARQLKFRTKSVQALSVERRAKHLAQLPWVSEGIAMRALIAYHFTMKRPLMGAFLDGLGIAHKDGLIEEEKVDPPSVDRLQSAITSVRASVDIDDLDLYLRTLAALDGETWTHLQGLVPLAR